MANADTPFGFRPVKNLSGAPFTGGGIRCVILAADETATFVGDLVRLSGSASSDGAPSVEQGAASDTDFFGVITSFEPDRTNLELKYRLADTERYCNVVPCNDALFVVQADSSASVAATDIGETADVTVGSGDTTTGLSAMELNATNIGTGLNLYILGIDTRPDNEFGEHVDLIVRINETPMISGGDIGV